MTEVNWSRFATEANEFAEAGQRLLSGEDGVSIGFLATTRSNSPHLAPVCPFFYGDNLYLSATTNSPKARDLQDNGRYTLHAFLGSGDEEFQVSGHARLIADPGERATVHAAIPFASSNEADPLFELTVQSALWIFWENPGQADTRPIRKRWKA